MNLQRIINWILGVPEPEPEFADATERVVSLAIEVGAVTSVLKGRRLRRRRAAFRGFSSPPNRF
jgi:hypothetical protein